MTLPPLVKRAVPMVEISSQERNLEQFHEQAVGMPTSQLAGQCSSDTCEFLFKAREPGWYRRILLIGREVGGRALIFRGEIGRTRSSLVPFVYVLILDGMEDL